jgi:ParB-like chromosome segregation protein Spo0J
MNGQNGHDIREVPRSTVGLTPLGLPRRPRDIKQEGLERLATVDPSVLFSRSLVVRRWPEDLPNPEEYEWEVICGNHRWTHAHTIGWESVRIDVRDAPTDREYIIIAWKENLDSPLEMTPDENRNMALQLRAEGTDHEMSYAEIGKLIGKTKAWVAQVIKPRDTHAASKEALNGATAGRRDDDLHADAAVATGWAHIRAAALEEKRRIAIERQITKAITNMTTDIAPEEMKAYIESFTLGTLDTFVEQIDDVLAGFWWNVRTAAKARREQLLTFA